MRTRGLCAAFLLASALAGCSSSDAATDRPAATASAYTTSPTGALAAARERFDGAYDFCIEQVTNRLKAPATARFSARDRDNEAKDGDRYLFTGTVDSENGFGALIRSEWSCDIRWTGGEYVAASVVVS